MWIQHRSLTLPSSPHRLSGLGAVYTLSHTHLLCHSVWDSYLPAIQWLSLHKVGTLQPVLSGPLPCDLSLSTSHWLVDSTILWNSSPPLPSPWIQWTHRVWRFSSHCWKLMPGTLLLGSSWEHSSTLHPPHMETPGPPIGRGWTLTPRSHSCLCQGLSTLLVASFGLHISAFPCPHGTIFQWFWPAQLMQPCHTI